MKHLQAYAFAGLAAVILSSTLPRPGSAADAAPAAEFGGQCLEALAEGQHVATNCSVSWTDQDGRKYCFSTESAKKIFLQNTAGNLQKARDFAAASNVDETEKAMQEFSGTDAEKLVSDLIDAKSKANGGLFPFEDPLNGNHLKLIYDGIDFTRTIDGYGFFPDVKFHDAADAKKNYLIDFWVLPAGKTLQVQEIRIHKEPIKSDGMWTAMTRQPVAWWWIPASEHPGHLATKRGWEVMSAVERKAMTEAVAHDGVFELKDDKTGQVLKLEFVDTHQPVRQLDDGQYFACTDFRVIGTQNEIYDIDFWVSDKDGKMTVDQTRVHKVPALKSGEWIQVPRYEWKDLGQSHVVP